jgi:peptidoglycan/LPS O-acetylase OafA/YrhL
MDTPASRMAAAERSDHTGYRADVDGLRAVSILAVVAFHVGIPGFEGGFVGVDIFFVISGYLIIGQIRAGIDGGAFSIADFYARRALRILPPYLLMLAACFVVAPFVLVTIKQYEEFALSAVTAPMMVSNVYFYLKFGYFDLAADLKPLLHTWTLSVEEQFYVVAPVTLMLVASVAARAGRRLLLGVAVVLMIASFLGSLAYSGRGAKDAAFYLSHWRAWQFIAGGLVGAVSIGAARRLPPGAWAFAAALGLAAILAAVLLFSPALTYPFWPALLPVGGAALLILAGMAAPGNPVTRLLSTKPMVGIGLVSYSWYLWHWPILSFARTANFDGRSLGMDLAGGGALAFLLAVATYFWVEVPVRNWRRTHDVQALSRRIVAAGMAGCTATIVIGMVASGAGYLIARKALETHYGFFGGGEDQRCWLKSGTVPEACKTGPIGIVIGDSHAAALFGSFARQFRRSGVVLNSVAEGGCNPLTQTYADPGDSRDPNCAISLHGIRDLMGRFSESPRFAVIHARWGAYVRGPESVDAFESGLRKLIKNFADDGMRVVLIGPVPVFERNALSCVVLSDRYGSDRDRCLAERSKVDDGRRLAVAAMQKISGEFGNVRFVDPVGVFCDATVCRPFDGDTVLYVDDSHVGPAGADRVFEAFARDMEWAATTSAAAAQGVSTTR